MLALNENLTAFSFEDIFSILKKYMKENFGS